MRILLVLAICATFLGALLFLLLSIALEAPPIASKQPQLLWNDRILDDGAKKDHEVAPLYSILMRKLFDANLPELAHREASGSSFSGLRHLNDSSWTTLTIEEEVGAYVLTVVHPLAPRGPRYDRKRGVVERFVRPLLVASHCTPREAHRGWTRLWRDTLPGKVTAVYPFPSSPGTPAPAPVTIAHRRIQPAEEQVRYWLRTYDVEPQERLRDVLRQYDICSAGEEPPQETADLMAPDMIDTALPGNLPLSTIAHSHEGLLYARAEDKYVFRSLECAAIPCTPSWLSGHCPEPTEKHRQCKPGGQGPEADRRMQFSETLVLHPLPNENGTRRVLGLEVSGRGSRAWFSTKVFTPGNSSLDHEPSRHLDQATNVAVFRASVDRRILHAPDLSAGPSVVASPDGSALVFAVANFVLSLDPDTNSSSGLRASEVLPGRLSSSVRLLRLSGNGMTLFLALNNQQTVILQRPDIGGEGAASGSNSSDVPSSPLLQGILGAEDLGEYEWGNGMTLEFPRGYEGKELLTAVFTKRHLVERIAAPAQDSQGVDVLVCLFEGGHLAVYNLSLISIDSAVYMLLTSGWRVLLCPLVFVLVVYTIPRRN